MSWDDYQPESNSRFFKATDLPENRQPIWLTILQLCHEDVGDDGEKSCLQLDGHEEREFVVLNHNRFDQLREIFPDVANPQELHGEKIGLKRGRTQFKGKRVDCVELVPAANTPPPEVTSGPNGDADGGEDEPF